MKIVVTHNSPDWDAITSVWLIKRFLPGWENAQVRFVPAGSRLNSMSSYTEPQISRSGNPIEKIGQDEVIHVDTGLGPLDHHQTQDQNVCGASLTFDYVKQTQNSKLKAQNNPFDKLRAGNSKLKIEDVHSQRWMHREEAIARIVKVVVDIDHFKEVFWENPTADYHEFSLLGVLEGLKLLKPDQDLYYVDMGMAMLDALLHNFENRIWAEKEIAEIGIKFKTKWGDGMGFETINDTILSLAQKMGYAIVVRKDPRKEYIRIKARPTRKLKVESGKLKNKEKNSQLSTLNSQLKDIDLTLAYEKLKKMDPQATWFLHVSKKMLLNGTVKNPTMRATTLSLKDIIKMLEKV